MTHVSEKYPYKETEKLILKEIKRMAFYKISDPRQSRLIYICGEGVTTQDCVRKASNGDIVINLSGNDAVIYFPENPEVAISLKDHGFLKLLELAREYWESESKKIDYFTKSSDKKAAAAQLYDTVWGNVNSLVCKKDIILEANHILVLTGAIFSAWEESKTTQKPISKILFDWQSDGEKGRKEFTLSVLKERTELYQKGLELLRKNNPDLEPITIQSFEAALEKHPTLPEDDASEQAEGCVIS